MTHTVLVHGACADRDTDAMLAPSARTSVDLRSPARTAFRPRRARSGDGGLRHPPPDPRQATPTGSCRRRSSRASRSSRSAICRSTSRASTRGTWTMSRCWRARSRDCASSSTISQPPGPPPDDWASFRAAAHDNVFAKVSARRRPARRCRSRPWMPRAGARLLCGSDWPVSVLNGIVTYGRRPFARSPSRPGHVDRLLHGTTTTLYSLRAPGGRGGRVTALTDQAIAKDLIMSGEFAAASKLKEQDLAKRLGLSRNSVREAVRALTLMSRGSATGRT